MSLDQIAIRIAEPSDAHAIAQVHDDAWRSTYRGIIPGVVLERMINRRGPAWWSRLLGKNRQVLVLDHGGVVAGYATFGANRSGMLPVRGEVYELYMSPVYQGLGFGGRLLEAASNELAKAGARSFVVWVLEDNVQAVGFYQAMGGTVAAQGMERLDRDDQTDCKKVALVWQTGLAGRHR